MEIFNMVAGLCSVFGFVSACVMWVYERLETKRITDAVKKENRISYHLIRF